MRELEGSDLLETLVRKVSRLETEVRRIDARDIPFGTVRSLGGNNMDGPAVAWDLTSTSYVDLAGANYTRKTFTKELDNTDLLVIFHVSGYLQVGTSTVMEIGVQVDATDWGSRPWAITPNLTFSQFSGFVAIGGGAGGVLAGARGIELRARIKSGSGTFRMNANTQAGYTVWEVPGSLTFV